MNKVAVFGNAGGGKSTLARRLAEITMVPKLEAGDEVGDGACRIDRPHRGSRLRRELRRCQPRPRCERSACRTDELSSAAWAPPGYGTRAF